MRYILVVVCALNRIPRKFPHRAMVFHVLCMLRVHIRGRSFAGQFWSRGSCRVRQDRWETDTSGNWASLPVPFGR
jgi:hypothetical protein